MELDVLGVEQEGTEELVGRSVEHDVLDAEWRDVELDELEGCVVEEGGLPLNSRIICFHFGNRSFSHTQLLSSCLAQLTRYC